jgi:ubiquinone/menaquinone biosynthesis C-methylase UbiE
MGAAGGGGLRSEHASVPPHNGARAPLCRGSRCLRREGGVPEVIRTALPAGGNVSPRGYDGDMSWLMAAVYDRFCSAMEEACLTEWRQHLLGSLRGAVLEVGAGTGVNVPLYPDSLERLVLTEPDPHMRRQLERKHGHLLGGRIEFVDAVAESLPADDGSFDVVVSTLVLCSVPEPARSLREIHRVLRPGGRFMFLEHVAADPHHEPARRRWQHRLEPLWKRVAGNCHLTRETEAHIRDAGFELEWVERESLRKALPIIRPSIRGAAVRPG